MFNGLNERVRAKLQKAQPAAETVVSHNNVPKNEKVFSPKTVRELLNIDNEKIIDLCRKISLIPKKNAKGQTYFSHDDVKILKHIKDLQEKAALTENLKKNINPALPIAQPPVKSDKAQVKTVVDAELTKRAVETIEKLNQTLSRLETSFADNVSTKISKIMDEKLDGMDEVVVELIRTKTENESLRHKINDLNKENFYLKNDLSAYKSIGFGFYTKKPVEIDEV